MEPRIPLDKKVLLTLKEAAELTGIGISTLRKISDAPDCSFVIFVGNKRMLKRRLLELYLEDMLSI
jgi:excisionase family DNA binding protein